MVGGKWLTWLKRRKSACAIRAQNFFCQGVDLVAESFDALFRLISRFVGRICVAEQIECESNMPERQTSSGTIQIRTWMIAFLRSSNAPKRDPEASGACCEYLNPSEATIR